MPRSPVGTVSKLSKPPRPTAPTRRWALSVALVAVGAVTVTLTVVGVAPDRPLPADVSAPPTTPTTHAPATTGPGVLPPTT